MEFLVSSINDNNNNVFNEESSAPEYYMVAVALWSHCMPDTFYFPT